MLDELSGLTRVARVNLCCELASSCRRSCRLGDDGSPSDVGRCHGSPAAPPAVGVAVLVPHLADQSLLSQLAPRSQDALPLVLVLLELRFWTSQKIEHLVQLPLRVHLAQVPRTEALRPQQSKSHSLQHEVICTLWVARAVAVHVHLLHRSPEVLQPQEREACQPCTSRLC